MRFAQTISAATAAALGLLASGCGQPGVGGGASRVVTCAGGMAPVAFPAATLSAPPPFSVAAMDRVTVSRAHGGAAISVDAKFLVLTGDGDEAEFGAIVAALEHRGVPYDVFVATDEPPLTRDRLWSGDHGYYQATILSNSSLWVGNGSALAASEWAVLAEYEALFHVRRASLNTWPDPALGFGSSTASTSRVTVRCTTAGSGVFRDVNCVQAQTIEQAYLYLSRPVSGAPLIPLLTDTAGNALAAVHQGADGRESLLLLFANNQYLPHSLVFLHGVIGWAAGGAYLGERRIDLSAQVDDLFLASDIYGGGEYRMSSRDAVAALAWLRRGQQRAQTPDFRVAYAFNGDGAGSDSLTNAIRNQRRDWHWINHTFTHEYLDPLDYDTAFDEFQSNHDLAASLGLVGYDVRNVVTPGVSGLVSSAVMQAAVDAGIRFAVTDSSRPGCDNPSPNTAFYNAFAPQILLIPRRPTNLFYNVATPAQWTAEYNDFYRDYWGRNSTYTQVINQESDVLLIYLLRGEADPWMFHQANLRAYDGTRSLLGDLLDAAVTKLGARLRTPIRTPAMHTLGQRFADRARYDTAGVRATLFPGRALLLDAAAATSVPVTGVRAADGQAYGGDIIRVVSVVPGITTCVALDAAGTGCSPPPAWDGEAGMASPLPTAVCDAGAGS